MGAVSRLENGWSESSWGFDSLSFRSLASLAGQPLPAGGAGLRGRPLAAAGPLLSGAVLKHCPLRQRPASGEPENREEAWPSGKAARC
jgi:hypothetical protein